MTKERFYSVACEKGYYSRPGRLKFYLKEYLFKGVEIAGRSLIDIGGGNGLLSYYAALNGAGTVVVMEPEMDGSSDGVIRGFYELHQAFGNPSNISLTTDVLERFDRSGKQFDIILMHDSINHIDEDACARLPVDETARAKYLTYFDLLRDISHPGTRLIICDCSNRNFWASVLGKNPMAPTIDWHKHQPPAFWASLLSQRGFRHGNTRWSSPNMLRSAGRMLLGSRVAAYFTYSHFRLEMVRC